MIPGTGECVEVLLDRAARIADRPLTYRVPAALRGAVGIGVRALVPLGSRAASGFVVRVGACPDAGASGDAVPAVRQIREVLDVPDPTPLFSPPLLELARWIAEDTVSRLLDAVRCLVPPEIVRRPPASPRVPQVASVVRERIPRTVGSRQRQILDRLLAAPGGLPLGDLVRDRGGAALRRLVAAGAVRVAELPRPAPAAAGPVAPAEPAGRPAPELPLLLWADPGPRARWIVDAVRDAVARGGQSLITEPEVELAERLADRLRDALGDRVALFHSDLPSVQHRAVWRRILEGEADVVVGTRSALFAPLRRLRLLIVDEEQDPSYKADAAPRYHGRTVALRRGALEHARIVLGSPAPSVETYAAHAEGRMRCERLPSRAERRVTIVDMRQEREAGRTGALSRPLVEAMRRHLRAGGRAALFVNRIGYARVLRCQECGHAVRCPQCELPMLFDREAGTIRCRVCGRVALAPAVCPRCKGVSLRWVGAGTKRIEEVVRRVFPALEIARVDRETASGFDAVAREFASGRVRVLVGTQLLLRGRRVRPSLIGVVDADAPLYRPDFRAGERAFQQLRALISLATAPPAAEAVVQTRMPEHPALAALATGRDELLYEDELRIRREFGYPPYAHLARVVASARDAAAAVALAARAGEAARTLGIEVLGPSLIAPAGGRAPARAQCLLRGPTREAVRDAARAAQAAVAPSGRGRGAGNGRVVVDVDPQEVA